MASMWPIPEGRFTLRECARLWCLMIASPLTAGYTRSAKACRIRQIRQAQRALAGKESQSYGILHEYPTFSAAQYPLMRYIHETLGVPYGEGVYVVGQA